MAERYKTESNGHSEQKFSGKRLAMADFNNGVHAEAQRMVSNAGEVIFNAKVHTGPIVNPNKVDHFVDAYTDLSELAPVAPVKR